MEANQTKLECNKSLLYLFNTKRANLLQNKATFLLQIGKNLLQIRAGITYRRNYYKSVHNKLLKFLKTFI